MWLEVRRRHAALDMYHAVHRPLAAGFDVVSGGHLAVMVMATAHPRSRAKQWNALGSPEGKENTGGSLRADVRTPVIRGNNVDDDCEGHL